MKVCRIYRIATLLSLLLILVGSAGLAAAQVADWVEIPLQFSPDRRFQGFCDQPSQCLVHPDGGAAFAGQPDLFFETDDPTELPRCINNRQFILDNFCENGKWTTRTKLVAMNLVDVARILGSQTDFTLFCGPYTAALNNFNYAVQGVDVLGFIIAPPCIKGIKSIPCVNNFCTLRAKDKTAFATTVNVDLDDEQSFLKALGMPTNACNNVNQNLAQFQPCSQNPSQGILHYHPVLEAIAVLPPVVIASPPNTGQLFNSVIRPRLSAIQNYAAQFNDPTQPPAFNLSFFNTVEKFNNLYLAVRDTDTAFGFLETEKFTKFGSIQIPIEYLGVRYTNIAFKDPNPCTTYIKARDAQAFCENQTTPGASFIAAARRLSQPIYFPYNDSFLVDSFSDLTAKLRLGGKE